MLHTNYVTIYLFANLECFIASSAEFTELRCLANIIYINGRYSRKILQMYLNRWWVATKRFGGDFFGAPWQPCSCTIDPCTKSLKGSLRYNYTVLIHNKNVGKSGMLLRIRPMWEWGLCQLQNPIKIKCNIKKYN